MLHARLRGRQAPALLLAAALAVAGHAPPMVSAAHAARRDDIAAAESLAGSGRHAEAAQLYEKAAKRLFGWDVDVALRAAREYLAAGSPDDAERLIDKVARRARGEDAALVAELRRGIAHARQAREAPAATTTPLPGEERPATAPPRVPSEAAPPAVMLPSGAPSTVALLLPLTGRYRSAGTAVRDGFIAACLTDPADARPRVAIYDTAANGIVASYQQALAGGAQFIVGPLMKDELALLVASGQFPVPTLALNTLAGQTPPSFLFQFSLDPEEEARAVARRIAADGHAHGIALFPENDWGRRVHEAFSEELLTAGVTLSAAQFYTPGARDFAGPLRAALGRFGGAGDRPDDKRKPLPPPRDPVAEARDGPQFAFIAANAATARAIKPQLRFQMTYPLPVYATSDAWEASTRAANDMEGLVYPEMPWVLYGGQGATELWDLLHGAWSEAGRGRLRLYAFGFDAFRLTGELRSTARSFGLDGLTGELDVAADGRVLRRLEWASIQGGRPQAAGLSAPLPAPVEP